MKQKQFTSEFKNISKKDVALAGGKGASLGEMTQAGFPVPEGFVVLASAFDQFLKETSLFSAIDAELHKVNYKDMNSVEQASEAIQEMIIAREIPQQIAAEVLLQFKKLNMVFVAVRSSATAEDSSSAAWAGQLNTYLNTTDKTLLENVKKCWASLFTPRAIFYRFEKNLHDHHISVAVVVQKMIASEIAGVAFSVHPVTCDSNQMIIEAGYGLGEALVSGQITPDSYVIEKDKMLVIDKRVGSQQKMLVRDVSGGDVWEEVGAAKKDGQKLTDKQITLLAKLVVKIEKHYGFPVDVEWAFADGKLYILQSRPITTLVKENANQQKNFETADRILREYHITPPFIHKGFHAYFYPIDFVQLLWNQWGKYSGYYYSLHISVLHNNYWDLYYIPQEFTALRNHYLQKVHKNECYLKEHYRDWEESCIKLSKLIDNLDASFKNKDSFLRTFEKYKTFVDEYVFEYALSAPIQEACGFQPEQWINPLLEEFCRKYKRPYQETSALLTSPVVHSFITNEEIELLKISLAYKINKDAKKLHEALLNHQKKWFWIQNNYATVKIISLEELGKRSEDIQKLTLQQLKEKILHLEKMPFETKKKKNMLFQKYKPSPKLRLYIKITELFTEMQDTRKGFVLTANHYHKLFLEAVSLKYQQPLGCLWYYSYNELCYAIKNNSFLNMDEIEKRKEMVVKVESKSEKIIISGDEAKYFFEKLQEKVSDVIDFGGTVAQPGKVCGRVVIILKSHHLLKVSEGDILVSSMTRPEMVHAMKLAAAFVTDEGGITSHAAIVAREMKKPCIIGTKIATKVLKDGDLVEVDANKGIVRKLSSELVKERLYDQHIAWVHYLTRPFSLFGASFWQAWYDSEEIKTLIHATTPDALFVEEHLDVVRYYKEKKQISNMREAMKTLIRNDPKRLKEICKRGYALNKEAEKILKKGYRYFPNLDASVRFAIDLALHATVIPNVSLGFFDAMNIKDKALRELAIGLREKSYYPRMLDKIVMPHIKEILRKQKIQESASDLFTLSEIFKKDFTGASERIQARKEGKRFVFQICNGKEKIQWTDDVRSVIQALEGVKIETNMKELKGQTAYRGKVTGVARLVLSDTGKGVHFEKGDILISINSNPSLMPLLLKCAAIVTDEGGISCHAAVVSRELKKPCVMSTKYATAVIKDGDLVEVDADKGIVRKIK